MASGINGQTLANDVRVVVALLCAFWPFLLPLLRFRPRHFDARVGSLILWITPGLAFFLFSYFADAPYLNFATAAVLLLGLMLLEHSTPRMKRLTVGLCLTWNIGFFLFFTPVLSSNLLINTVNCYAGRFTHFSLQHQAFPNLSAVMKDPTLLFRPTHASAQNEPAGPEALNDR